MKKVLYVILGCVFVTLGAVGAVLPVLPTVPFLLLAAYCFARSSERLHTWFQNTKLCEPPHLNRCKTSCLKMGLLS